MLTKRHPKYVRTTSSWSTHQEERVAPEKSTTSPPNSTYQSKTSTHGFHAHMNQSLAPYMDNLRQWLANSTMTFREPLVERRMLLFSIDMLILMIAILTAQIMTGEAPVPLSFLTLPSFWNTTIAILLVWWLLSALNDLYDVSSSAHMRATATRLCVIGVMGALLYWLLWALAFPDLPSVRFFFTFASLGLPAIWAWRSLCMTVSNYLAGEHRVLIIGLGRPGQVIYDLLQKADYLNYRVIGFIADHAQGTGANEIVTQAPLGGVKDLPVLLAQYQVNEVVLATQGDVSGETFQQLVVCQGQGIKISWMPTLYEKLCHSVPIEYIDPDWALFAMQGQPIFSRLQLTAKRLIDLTVVLLCLPMFLLLFPLLALLIRLDSPGPIFYRQVRTGRGGKPFSIWKFRTMVTDAEKDGKPRWAQQNDNRITRIGRIMRKTRLDELPQIFNILLGDMSLVGPRPERPEFIEVLQQEIPYYHTRLMVKPGLTGWAQVSYDYGNTTEDALQKLHYDFYYIRYWSLWLDFYIIFKTISIVLKFKGL